MFKGKLNFKLSMIVLIIVVVIVVVVAVMLLQRSAGLTVGLNTDAIGYIGDGRASLYSIWKPNAVDGMDSRFIGRAGSSPTGQYALS